MALHRAVLRLERETSTRRFAVVLLCVPQLCCMKVEVDMEKISAEIAAVEEAARKRMADREKDAGDRSAREAPACVLAEEEKHICATHGNKSQQPPLADGGNKQCETTESNGADAAGEPGSRRYSLLSKRRPFI